MDFKDYFLSFNNKDKEQLRDTYKNIKKNEVDEKHKALFDFFDANKDEQLDEDELKNIARSLDLFAGEDKIFDKNENEIAGSIFGEKIKSNEEIDFMGFVKSVTEIGNKVNYAEEKDLLEPQDQDLYRVMSKIIESNGKANYDPQIIIQMFNNIENGNAKDWEKVSEGQFKGSGSYLYILDKSTGSTFKSGTLEKIEKYEKFYVIEYDSGNAQFSVEFAFDKNGNYLYKETLPKNGINICQREYPNGKVEIIEFNKYGTPSFVQEKDNNGKVTYTQQLEYENSILKSRSTIYSEFYPDKEHQNTIRILNNNGEKQVFGKDKNGEYTVPISSCMTDRIPVLDNSGKIVRYCPYIAYNMKYNEQNEPYLDYMQSVQSIGDIQKSLKPGEHLDLTEVNKELKDVIVQTMESTIQLTLEMLENWQESKSWLDASTWLDKLEGIGDLDVASGIKKLKGLLDEIKELKNTTNDKSFAEKYRSLTGNTYNTNEMQKWLNVSYNLTLCSLNGKEDIQNISTYLKYAKKGLEDTLIYQENALISGNSQGSQIMGNAIDICAMFLEFGVTGKIANWTMKGGKLLLKSGANVVKAKKYVTLAHEFLTSENKFAKIASKALQVTERATASGLTFAIYDGVHEAGKQLYNKEDLDLSKIGEASWHGAKLGATSALLSSFVSEPLMKLFKSGVAEKEVTEAINKCLKKGKTSGAEIAKAIQSVTPQMGLVAKATNFLLEAGTFSLAASTIDLTDGKQIKDLVRESNQNRPKDQQLTEDQINNMSTTDLMKATLDAQGVNTTGMSDSQIWWEYASNQYKESFLGMGQMKLAEHVVGMFLSKGHMPTSGEYGKRVKELHFSKPDKDGKVYLNNDPNKKPLTTDEVTAITYQAMAFDTLEARLNNRFNKYKKEPISGKEFLNMAVGKHESCKADDLIIKVTNDGKYEVYTPSEKYGEPFTTTDSIEGIFKAQQRYEFQQKYEQGQLDLFHFGEDEFTTPLTEQELENFTNDLKKVIRELEKTHPQFARKIATEKLSDGTPRFGSDDVERIVNSHKKNPELTEKLLDEKLPDGTPRFKYVYDIEGIVTSHAKNPELVERLLDEKLPDGTYRFYPDYIPYIANAFTRNPKLVERLLDEKLPDGTYRFQSKAIASIAYDFRQNPELVERLLNDKLYDGTPRFEFYQIGVIVTLYKKNPELAERLINEKLKDGNFRFNGNDIPRIVSLMEKEPKLLDSLLNEKLQNGEFKYSGRGLASYNFNDPNKFNIIREFVDNIQGQIDGVKYKSTSDNVSNLTINTSDGKVHDYVLNNEGQVIVKYDADVKVKERRILENLDELINSSKEVKDDKGNLLYTERYEQSADIPGKYDIIREYPDGTKDKIGLAEKTQSGETVIEKNFVSDDGTKTNYVYMEQPDGGRISYTRITDSDGKVLLNNQTIWEKIDDNHFQTKENGQTYDIEYKEDKVVVTRGDGEKVEIKIGENAEGTEGVLSKELLPLLKKLPGSIYFDIKEYGLTKIGKEIHGVKSNNAHYSPYFKLVALSKEKSGEEFIFTLLHELGHYKDFSKSIRDNIELRKIYDQECSEFNKSNPAYVKNKTDYFTIYTGGIGEMIAEVNAFLHSLNRNPNIEMRGQYLQEHFPKTFAKIAQLLNAS